MPIKRQVYSFSNTSQQKNIVGTTKKFHGDIKVKCYALKISTTTKMDNDKQEIYHKSLVSMRCTIPTGGKNLLAKRDMIIQLGKDVECFGWLMYDWFEDKNGY